MKKICMLLVLLSSVAFAVDLKQDACKKQDLGGCETLFICPNNISLIVKYLQNGSTCVEDNVISKHLIDTKEQKVIEVPTKK